MNPAELIGDILVVLVSLAVVGILLWFIISQWFPTFFGHLAMG